MISKDTKNIVILSFLVVVVWVLIEIYHITANDNVEPQYKNNLAPINKEINLETLKALRGRITIDNNK